MSVPAVPPQMQWVSLHSHTTFSYGDGFGPVATHVDRCADLGMTSLALTEHGNVSSWVQLEKNCNRRGLKPIFGIEAYVAEELQPRKFHMILLAMDEQGLRNLNTIVTESWKTLGTTSKSKFPTVHSPVMRKYSRGIIALSGCADGPISCILLGGKSLGSKRTTVRDSDYQRARVAVERFQAIFGDRYYLETQRFPGLDRTCALNPAFERLSVATGARLAGTADVHYAFPGENKMQRILHSAHRGGTVESVDAEWEYNILLTYPESDSEVYGDLVATGLSPKAATAAVQNTTRIAERCNVTLPKAPPPKYVIDSDKDWRHW